MTWLGFDSSQVVYCPTLQMIVDPGFVLGSSEGAGIKERARRPAPSGRQASFSQGGSCTGVEVLLEGLRDAG